MKHDKIVMDLARIACTGRFRAVVHTGHTFDDEGRIIKRGEVLRETPFGRNTITLTGFNNLLSRTGTTRLAIVAGSGNATPTESDLILTAYLGKMSTRTSVTTSINNDIGSGPLFYRLTYTATFNPGAFGVSSVNVAEAGVTFTEPTLGNINSTTLIGAHGLLVDGGGSPTTVAVAPDEYLDIVWEYTEWLPHDATGTVSIDIDGVPTDHTYYVRPAYLGSWLSGGGWKPTTYGAASDTAQFPDPANEQWMNAIAGGVNYQRGSAVAAGPLGVASEGPSGAFDSSLVASSMGLATYATDSKQRGITMAWAPTRGNVGGAGIGAVTLILGHTQWQVSYDPPIEKVASKQLSLTFNLALANAT